MQTKIWIPLLSDGVGSMFCLNSPASSIGSHGGAGALVFHCTLLHLYFGKSQILICLSKLFGGNQQPHNRHTLFPHGSYGEMLPQLQNCLQFQILSCKDLKLHERTTFSAGYNQEVGWNDMNYWAANGSYSGELRFVSALISSVQGASAAFSCSEALWEHKPGAAPHPALCPPGPVG